jgi:hypothetical protein
VYLLAFGGSPEHAAAIDRVLATAIGGLLAFAAYVAWPTWARDHVAEDLALLLEAQSAFARHVLQAFLEPQHFDAGAMRAAQLASRLQRTNTEAAVDLMKSEPVSTRGISLATAQGILAASRRIGVASLTMGARIGDREDASRDVLARLIADFDTAMAIVVRSLRDVATPAPLPPLRVPWPRIPTRIGKCSHRKPTCWWTAPTRSPSSCGDARRHVYRVVWPGTPSDSKAAYDKENIS